MLQVPLDPLGVTLSLIKLVYTSKDISNLIERNSEIQANSLRTGFLTKFHFPPNWKTNGDNRKCSSRAFQWMVMVSTILKYFCAPLGDRNHHQSFNTLKPTTVYRRYWYFPWNALKMVRGNRHAICDRFCELTSYHGSGLLVKITITWGGRGSKSCWS
jgi:hypothetical protein